MPQQTGHGLKMANGACPAHWFAHQSNQSRSRDPLRPASTHVWPPPGGSRARLTQGHGEQRAPAGRILDADLSPCAVATCITIESPTPAPGRRFAPRQTAQGHRLAGDHAGHLAPHDLEAARLQDDLRRARIEPWGWVVNTSLAATGTAHPVLAARAATEAPEIARMRDDLDSRYAVVAMQAEYPVGAERLRALTGAAPASAAE